MRIDFDAGQCAADLASAHRPPPSSGRLRAASVHGKGTIRGIGHLALKVTDEYAGSLTTVALMAEQPPWDERLPAVVAQRPDLARVAVPLLDLPRLPTITCLMLS